MHDYLETFLPRLQNRLLNRTFTRTTLAKPGNDSSRNHAPLIRLPVGNAAEKTIALTFDDGPTPFGTRVLLDLLERFQVKATFFVVGRNAVRHPHLVAEIVAAGHAVGNHSYHHQNPWRQNSRSMLRDFQKCTEVLESLAVDSVQWIRPPFGRISRRMFQWSRRQGMDVALWDVSIADSKTKKSVDEAHAFLMKHLNPASIIRFHDNPDAMKLTPALLDRVLPQLIDDGWRFEALPTTSPAMRVAA